MILIILLYAFFAASVLGSKAILIYTTPIFLTGVRMTIAGLLLVGYQYIYNRSSFAFQKKHLLLFAQFIFFGIYVAYIMRYWGLSNLSAAKAMFLHNMAPFFSALYSYLIFSEKMTWRRWTGLILGFIGIIPILITTSTSEKALGEFFYISWAEFAILIAVASHSYSWVVMRRLIRDHRYQPMTVNGIAMTIGGFAALVTSFFLEGKSHIEHVFYFSAILAFIILISNVVCHNLYGHLLRKYTATFLSFAGFLAPIFAALYEWVLYNRGITWHYYVSSIVMIAGLYLFYKDELQEQFFTS